MDHEEPDPVTKALIDAMNQPAEPEPRYVQSKIHPCGGIQPGGTPVDIWELRRQSQALRYPRYRLPLPPAMGRVLPHRGSSRCGRCARPWWAVRHPHLTEYDPKPDTDQPNDTYGQQLSLFPLCHRCWASLRSPDRRLPYYRNLFEKWRRDCPDHYTEEAWAPIAQAVQEGL